MRKNLFLLCVILGGIIQVTLLSYLRIFSVTADIFLILAVWAAVFLPAPKNILYSAGIGFFKDIFSTMPFGINTLIFALLAFLIVKICKKIAIDDTLRYAVLVVATAALYNLIFASLLLFLGLKVSVGIILRNLFFASFYTAVLTPPVFTVLEKIVLKRK